MSRLTEPTEGASVGVRGGASRAQDLTIQSDYRQGFRLKRRTERSSQATKLTVDNVSVSFVTRRREEITALTGVSFTVEEGEFLCILGPSGCGKSTLLQMMAGFVEPSSGTLSYNDQIITGPSASRAMVFQDYALFTWMTVFDNVAFGLVAKKMERKERERRVIELLDFVGLTKFKGHYPQQLSGGMQQRIALARALAPDPDVVLLDEPFGALDLLTRELMQEELLRLQKFSGKTFILVTHSVEEAVFLGTRVLLFSPRPGRIREDVTIKLPEKRDNKLRTENRAFLEYREHLSNALREGLEDGREGL